MSVASAARRATPPEQLAREQPAGRPTAWWGMVLFVTTEATLFAALFASYFYLRFRSAPQWPPGGIRAPQLRLPLIMTVLLVSSSAPMWWADHGIRQGRSGRLKLGLAVTFALGATFLALQGHEYQTKLAEFTPRTNAYGSLFFGITGFHGAHVLLGLLMNAFVQVAAWRGRFTAERCLHVQLAALYWHFVDAVWIVILASLYLGPHL